MISPEEFNNRCFSTINRNKAMWPKSWHERGEKIGSELVLANRGDEFLLVTDLWLKYAREHEGVRHPGGWIWSELTGEMKRLGRLERNGGLTGRKDGSNRSPASRDSINGWTGKATEPGSPLEPGMFNGGGDEVAHLSSGGGEHWSERFVGLSTLYRNEGVRRFERFEVKERHRSGSDPVKHQWSSALKYPWSKKARDRNPEIKDKSPGGNWAYRGEHPALAPIYWPGTRRELLDSLIPQHTGERIKWGADNAAPRPWETAEGNFTRKLRDLRESRGLKTPKRRLKMTKEKTVFRFDPHADQGAGRDGKRIPARGYWPARWSFASVWQPRADDAPRCAYHWLREALRGTGLVVWPCGRGSVRTMREEYRAYVCGSPAGRGAGLIEQHDASEWAAVVAADDVRWRRYDFPTSRSA